MTTEPNQIFDFAVCGAGTSGILAATRVFSLRQDCRLVLIEKESSAGGRLRAHQPGEKRWSYGLSSISEPLYTYWNQTLRTNLDAAQLSELTCTRQTQMGVLAAGKVSMLPVKDLFSSKGARLIGGPPASRDWSSVARLFEAKEDAEKADQNVGHFLHINKKSPSAVVLEQMAITAGIPDFWASAKTCFAQRTSAVASEMYRGDWDEAFRLHLEHLSSHTGFQFCPNHQLLGAEFNDGVWSLETQSGMIRARKLIVAQPPWDTHGWLPPQHWPPALLAVAIKTTPVSIVTLTEVCKDCPEDLPDLILVPAESTQIIVDKKKNCICYQAILDFETSLQAPEVVKAVKRLKRSRKKLVAAYPDMKLEGEHIALLPVGWAQAPGFGEQRWLKQIEKQGFCHDHLVFCGDAYGASYNGDENIVNSLIVACDKVLQKSSS